MTHESLGLDATDFSTLLNLLERYAPRTEIWAFGSRVAGKSRPFSDLDLVILNKVPLDLQTRAELNYALSESRLPIKIDLTEWARTSPSFRDRILSHYVVLKAA